MSYIHDALKKAQKEKGTLSQRYRGIVPARVSGPKLTSGKVLWVAPVLLGGLVFAAYLWFSSTDKQPPVPGRSEATAVLEEVKTSKDMPTPKAIRRPRAPQKRSALTRQKPSPKPEVTPTRDVTPKREVTRKPEPAARADTTPRQEPASIPQGQNKFAMKPSVTAPKPKEIPPPPKTENSAVLYEQARSFQRRGRWQEAKAMYERTLGEDPQHVGALNNMGVIYFRDRDFPAAREVFSEVVRLKPDYVDAYYNLACVYAVEGRLSESLVHLEKAVSLDESVKVWAREDQDLQNLHGVPDFDEIVGQPGSLE